MGVDRELSWFRSPVESRLRGVTRLPNRAMSQTTPADGLQQAVASEYACIFFLRGHSTRGDWAWTTDWFGYSPIADTSHLFLGRAKPLFTFPLGSAAHMFRWAPPHGLIYGPPCSTRPTFCPALLYLSGDDAPVLMLAVTRADGKRSLTEEDLCGTVTGPIWRCSSSTLHTAAGVREAGLLGFLWLPGLERREG